MYGALKWCHRQWEWMEPFNPHNEMPGTFGFKCQEAPGLCIGSHKMPRYGASLKPHFLFLPHFPTQVGGMGNPLEWGCHCAEPHVQ